MSYELRVILSEEVEMTGDQQKELAKAIDNEFFTGTGQVFSVSRNKSHVVVPLKVTTLSTEEGSDIGEQVADFFGTTCKEVKIESVR